MRRRPPVDTTDLPPHLWTEAAFCAWLDEQPPHEDDGFWRNRQADHVAYGSALRRWARQNGYGNPVDWPAVQELVESHGGKVPETLLRGYEMRLRIARRRTRRLP